MASTAVEATAGTLFTNTTLKHRLYCLDSCSPSSWAFSGVPVHFRVTFKRVLSRSRTSTQHASSTTLRHSVVRAATTIVGLVSSPKSEDAVKNDEDLELLACPVCYQPLSRKGIPGLNQQAISRSGFQCSTCKKGYSSRNVYLDLTVTSNAKVYSESTASGTELFRNPLVSYAYERGWRQNFARVGFPGPEEEVKMALQYFEPTFGGVLLDVSCGSGLFTRRFATLDLYSAIIAIDFSESMLRQTFEYIKEDEALSNKSIALVRADVARMPFATGSVDAVHAGAALHCWPSPVAGVAEISRILRPGGVFVATTFLSEVSALETSLLSFGRQVFGGSRPASGLRYWQEAELKDLIAVCGLLNYRRTIRQGFIMLSAQKPYEDIDSK